MIQKICALFFSTGSLLNILFKLCFYTYRNQSWNASLAPFNSEQTHSRMLENYYFYVAAGLQEKAVKEFYFESSSENTPNIIIEIGVLNVSTEFKVS